MSELIKLQEAASPVYGAKTGNTLYLKGKLQDTVPNKNKRIYGADVWTRLHNSPDYRHKIERGLYLGKLMHPKDDEEFDPNLAAVVLREQALVGTEVKGTIEVLRTPSGNILYTFHEAKIRMGVSSRADGKSVKKPDGFHYVSPEMFMFSGYDVVLDPSVRDALPEYLIESDYKTNEVNRLCSAIYGRLNEEAKPDLRELQFYSSFMESFTLDKDSCTFSTLMESLNTKMSDSQSYVIPPVVTEPVIQIKSINPPMANETTEGTRITESMELFKAQLKLETATEKLTELKESVTKHESSISTLNESVKAKDAEIAELTNKLNEATKRAETAEGSLATLTERHNAAKAVITELKESVDSTKETSKNLKESLKTVKGDLQKLNERHEAAKEIIDELDPIVEEYRGTALKEAVDAKLKDLPDGEAKSKLTESLKTAKTVSEVTSLHESFIKEHNPNTPTPADLKKLNESTESQEADKPMSRGALIAAAMKKNRVHV